MEDGTAHPRDSSVLARLFRLGEDATEIWDAQELAKVFRHQMNAPLKVDLPGQALREAESAISGRSRGEGPLRTFGDLLNHPNPPLNLLQLVKGFAKGAGSRQDAPLSRDIAAVLYLATIAAALVRCKEKITRMDNDAMNDRFQWVLRHEWIDPATRQLFEEAAAQTGHPRDRDREGA